MYVYKMLVSKSILSYAGDLKKVMIYRFFDQYVNISYWMFWCTISLHIFTIEFCSILTCPIITQLLIQLSVIIIQLLTTSVQITIVSINKWARLRNLLYA